MSKALSLVLLMVQVLALGFHLGMKDHSQCPDLLVNSIYKPISFQIGESALKYKANIIKEYRYVGQPTGPTDFYIYTTWEKAE